MTPLGWLGRKTSTQTKQMKSLVEMMDAPFYECLKPYYTVFTLNIRAL